MTRQHETHVLLDTLQSALESPLGLELEFLSETEASYFRQRLVQVRKDHPEYKVLALVLKGHRLWLAKTELEEPVNADQAE